MKTATKSVAFAVVVIAVLGNASALSDPAQGWRLRFPTEAETEKYGIPLVTKYMELSVKQVAENKNRAAERLPLISKEYLSSREVDPDLFSFNICAFEEFRVLGVKRNYVFVKGFNRSYGWAKLISFRILVENDSFVIEPSGISREDRLITCWWTISDLKDN